MGEFEKQNQKERMAFIKYWVKYMKENPNKWSKQQNSLINSVLKTIKQPTKEEYLKLKKQI